MTKIQAGFFFGAIAGVFDVIPMILMKLPLSADISAFVACLIGGFMIATSNLTLPAIPKGIVIYFLLALPIMIIVGASSLTELIPMLVFNVIIGTFLGYTINKYGQG